MHVLLNFIIFRCVGRYFGEMKYDGLAGLAVHTTSNNNKCQVSNLQVMLCPCR